MRGSYQTKGKKMQMVGGDQKCEALAGQILHRWEGLANWVEQQRIAAENTWIHWVCTSCPCIRVSKVWQMLSENTGRGAKDAWLPRTHITIRPGWCTSPQSDGKKTAEFLRHMARRNTFNPSKMRKRWAMKHDTAIAWYVFTWHTSNVPCVDMNAWAAYHVYIKNRKFTHPIPKHLKRNTFAHDTPAEYHVYTWTPTLPWRSIHHVCNFQKRDCIPTPPEMFKFRANPTGRSNILQQWNATQNCWIVSFEYVRIGR